jgi:hypothetical protein
MSGSDNYQLQGAVKSIDSMKDDIKSMRNEINALELRAALLTARVDRVEEQTKAIDGGFNWVVRTVGALIIGALAALIFTGGFPKI